MLMAKSDKALRISIMDLPEQLALARKNIEREGLNAQIALLPPMS